MAIGEENGLRVEIGYKNKKGLQVFACNPLI
jgi:hypothetical protein